VLYLFGASPAVCHTFFRDRPTSLPELSPGTYFGEKATSLRMSDVGYRNHRQAGLTPSMNSLASYLETLERAVSTPDPAYERFGTEVGGEWRQLSTNLLQIENELYGFIRPKQPVARGERPLHALRDRGVAYVEVRAIDVDPFSPVGISLEEMAFMEAFLWLCLLADSPPMDEEAMSGCDAHHSQVAAEGRRPGLVLEGAKPFSSWANEIFASMAPVCELLDRAAGNGTYTAALAAQRDKVADPERTPSARLLALIRKRGTSFFEVALELSHANRDRLLSTPLTETRRTELEAAAEASLAEQRELERSQTGTFADYVRSYFSPKR
jgi:glutamate--cysteine ligase